MGNTLTQAWTVAMILVPILGGGSAAWVNINTTLMKHDLTIQAQSDELKSQSAQISKLSERVTKIDENQLKIMFQLHIPLDEPRGYSCFPNCGTPTAKAPPHAMFKPPPQPVANTEPLPPLMSNGADESH